MFSFFCDSNIKEADTKFKTLYCNKLQCIFWYRLCDLFFFRFLSFSFHLSELIPPADIFNTSKRKDCEGEVLNFELKTVQKVGFEVVNCDTKVLKSRMFDPPRGYFSVCTRSNLS